MGKVNSVKLPDAISKEELRKLLNELVVEKWLCSADADDIKVLAERANCRIEIPAMLPDCVAGVKTSKGELIRTDKLIAMAKEKGMVTITNINGVILAIIKSRSADVK